MEIDITTTIGVLTVVLTFSTAVVTAIISLYKLYLSNKRLKSEHTMSLSDLRSTTVFERITSLKLEYSTFAHKCKIRRELFRDIICMKLEILHDLMKQLVINEDVGLLTDSEYLSRWKNLMSEATAQGYNRCKEEGIPEFILEKLIAKTETFMAISYSSIARVLEDDLTYPSKYIKTNVLIWDIIERIASEAPVVMRTLHEFNGDISSIMYKGYSKEDCSHAMCSCKKSTVKDAVIKQAELVRSHRTCIGSRPECQWRRFPNNLHLIDTIDLLNATLACSQCIYAKRKFTEAETQLDINEISEDETKQITE